MLTDPGMHCNACCNARIKAVHDKAQAATDSERIRQLEKEVSKLREERQLINHVVDGVD